MTDHVKTDRWLTIPNVITALRIIGSPLLVLTANLGQTTFFIILAGCLVITEWLDGFLARRLRVTSGLGARLDTVADAIFYSCLLFALSLLCWEQIAGEIPWVVLAIGSYGASWLASLLKFRRLPSYHTWAAKGCWLVVVPGIICLLLNWTALPFRIAMVCVAIANLEAICITFVLDQCRTDVRSFRQAMQLRHESPPHEQPSHR